VTVNERAVLVRDGIPRRALAPGRYRFWRKPELQRWSVDQVVFSAGPAVLEVLPTDAYDTLLVGPAQRALVYQDERPILWLRPGIHRLWRLDGVRVALIRTDEPVPELSDEARARIPATELLDVTVRQHERGLKYVNGRFEALLGPGRYLFWVTPQSKVAVTVVDQRVQQLTITGQELMTRDKVTLRLTLTAEYAPSDTPTAAHTVADVQAALYLAVQLAAREFVAGVTLDQLLEGRDELTRWLESQVVPRARQYGVEVARVGVKDVILPGEMKTLLNRVIEAEKEAMANVILRREEAAATRSMAQAAKIIAENPVLLRLKELDALKDIAGRVGSIELKIGHDAVSHLLPGFGRDV
jgi:hypothetical protein